MKLSSLRLLIILLIITFKQALPSAPNYEFTAAEEEYSVDSVFFTNNNLANGFTIDSGATVNWNFDATDTPITGPIILSNGGTFNISGTIKIANSDFSSIGLDSFGSLSVASTGKIIIANSGNVGISNTLSSFSLAAGGIVEINTSVDESGVGVLYNAASASIAGLINIANSAGSGIDCVNSTITIENTGQVVIANTGSSSNGIYNRNGSTINNAGSITVSNTAGNGIYNDATINNSGSGSITKNGLPYFVNNATIIDSNAYPTGFYVGGNVTVNWYNSPSLDASAVLGIDQDGFINGPIKKNGRLYITTSMTIDANSFGNYYQGFYVASGVTIIWESDIGNYVGPVVVENGATLIIASGGRMNTESSSINVAGTLTVNGAGNSDAAAIFANDITVDGIINVNNSSGCGIHVSTGTVNINNGGMVEINSTSDARAGVWFDNGSTLNVNGVLHVASSLTPNNSAAGLYASAGSTLNISNTAHVKISNTSGVGFFNAGTTKINTDSHVSINNSSGHGFYNSNVVNLDGIVTIENSGEIGFFDVSRFLNISASGVLKLNNSGGTGYSNFYNEIPHKNGFPYIIQNTTITDTNSTTPVDYTQGFYVASGVTVDWNSSDTVTGPIVVEGGATFNEVQPVVFGAGGSVTGAVTINVDDAYFAAYSLDQGFTVPAGTTMNWDVGASAVVYQPIHVEVGGTLNITPNGRLVANSWVPNNVIIDGILNINSVGDGSGEIGMTIQSGNTMTINGTVNISNDCYLGLINQGTIAVNSGGVININSINPTHLYASLYSQYGSIYVDGVINVSNCGLATGIYIHQDATLAVTGTISITNPSGRALHNDGTTQVTSAGTIAIQNSGGTGFYNNYGTLELDGVIGISSGVNGFQNYAGSIVQADTAVFNGLNYNLVKNTLPYILEDTTVTNATTPHDYINGFYVASGVTVTWNVDTAMTGPIIIEGAGKIVGSGTLTKNGLPYVVANKIITDTSAYTNGFVVGGGVTVTWSPPKITAMSGTLSVEEGGELAIKHGGMLNNGTIDINAGGVTIEDDVECYGIYNRGTINVNSVGASPGYLISTNSNAHSIGLFNDLGIINVNNGGVIRIKNIDGTGFYNNSNVNFNWEGLLEIMNLGGIGVHSRGTLNMYWLNITSSGSYGLYNAGGVVKFDNIIDSNGYADIENSSGYGILNDNEGVIIISSSCPVFSIQNSGGTGVVNKTGTFNAPEGLPTFSGKGSMVGDIARS